MDNVAYLIAVIFLELLIVSRNGCLGTISCFVCSSRNGSNTACEDPFNAGASTYTERCKVPKRDATSEKIVVRRCVMETMDTQCGKFRFEDDLLRGCILTCSMDGCNSSNVFSHSQVLLWLCLIFGLLVSSSSLPFLSQATIQIPNSSTNITKSKVHFTKSKVHSIQEKFDAIDIKIEENIPLRERKAHAEPA